MRKINSGLGPRRADPRSLLHRLNDPLLVLLQVYNLVTYYQSVTSYNAGILAALSNRIDDVALFMVIAFQSNIFGVPGEGY